MKKTKYPILLVHGMGFRDRKILNYWGRIPKKLKENGNIIYYGEQEANATIESNAVYLAKKINYILEKENVEKVNVIAHSKGGLDIRYAICKCGIADKIASVTTIATPHNGSKTMDILLKLPEMWIRGTGKILDFCMRICGDKEPNSYEVFHCFSTKFMKEFNKENQNVEGIYYQSYAFIMKSLFSDVLMFFPHLVVKVLEGDNDGLLTPEAVRWGEYQGVFTGTTRRGISHCDEVDIRRKRFCKKPSKRTNEISDMTYFYENIVEELAGKGF